MCLGLEYVGLGLVLGLEALSLKSKSGKNSGCSGIVQAPILPQWADRAQHFLNVVPPDLCICTKYGFVVVVCRKYSQKIDFPERKVQLYCFIAGFSFVYYSAYKLKACYAAVQLKVCYAAFRLKCKTLSCRRETARCLCH